MRFVLLVVTVLCYVSIKAQTDSTSTIYFNQIGWTIKLPNDFIIVDFATNAINTSTGKAIIEESIGQKIEPSKAKELINAAKNKTNYFSSSLVYSNKLTIQNWTDTDRVAKGSLFEILSEKIPTRVDTSSSIEMVGGRAFRKFTAVFVINEKINLRMIILSDFIKNCYVTIFAFFTDETAENEITGMLKNSHFDK